MFTCCQRKDESKYLHGPCGCPSATFTCESEEINPELCGWQEAEFGAASVPPIKYTSMKIELSGTAAEETRNFNCGEYDIDYVPGESVYSGSADYSFLIGGVCNIAEVFDSLTITSIDRAIECEPPPEPNCTGCSVTSTSSGADFHYPPSNFPSGSWWEESWTANILSKTKVTENPEPGAYAPNGLITKTISVADTENDAIARETPVNGTSCSSLWSTRATGFSWTKSTSKYTIECTNLVEGLSYKVTPTIQKRTAVIGSEGAWGDVTVAPTIFTAASDTKTFAAVSLSHVQGYEYTITGVSIEMA